MLESGERPSRPCPDLLAQPGRAGAQVEEPLVLETPRGCADRVGIVGAQAVGQWHPGSLRSRGQGSRRRRPRSQRVVRGNGWLRTAGSAGAATSPREAHTAARGHTSQLGARGVHVELARSMTASSQRLGRPRETRSSAAACNPDQVDGTPRTRDTTRRTFTSSGATGTPKADAATARAVYGPIPGSARSASTVAGTRPPWSATTDRAASRRARARLL